LALASGVTRSYAADVLKRDVCFSPAIVWSAILVIGALLVHICLQRFHAFEVNAWDFSISFDRPLWNTLRGDLLWSDTLGKSMLAVHCNWLLLAFVPLYALHPSPYWLVIAQPLAVIAAGAILFYYSRSVINDDIVAACVALAYIFNHYTVRAVNLGFVIDIFYPAAFLLLVYALNRRKFLMATFAALLVLSIKEDAILTLVSVALVAGIRRRHWIWCVTTIALASSVFIPDYFIVLPAFSAAPIPFAHYWGSFGATPAQAFVGMLRSPLKVIGRIWTPLLRLFSSMALLPLIGGDWAIAALPALVLYTSSDTEDLHSLALHYSLPVIGLLFASLPAAIELLSSFLHMSSPVATRRTIAAVALLASMFFGSGYKAVRVRPEHSEVRAVLAEAGNRRVYVQGALFPHAGYEPRYRVLDHDVVPQRGDAFLLCSSCNPYPFTTGEFTARLVQLRQSGECNERRRDDLSLFVCLGGNGHVQSNGGSTADVQRAEFHPH
jgi:uncharacterized membrane protein